MRACKLGLILLPFVALQTSCGDDASAKIDFQPRPDGGTSTSSVATGSAATSATTGTATTSSTTGAGGSGGNANTSDSTTGGVAGSVTTGGGSGGAGGSTGGSAGAAGSSGGAAGSGGSGTAGTGGQTTSDGGPGGGDITKVVPTTGCGKAPPPSGRSTIMTMGTKPQGCADSKCGAWSYEREYFLYLPASYNNTKAVPLVFQGPGCGAPRGGEDVYSLNSNVDGTVIRVGLTPPPNAIGHATAMNQGCFDDKEGDDSVDWVLYENLWDRLAGQLCFDKNRVFASGNSSGAWFANEVGCKYAGDPVHPIRGVMPNTGGLPTEARFKPTCTTKPMAGMWVHEVGDTTNPFAGNIYAIDRAMMVNGCTMGTSYSNAPFDPFAITATDRTSCKRMRGCPEIYPIVVCPLPGTGHGSHENVTNPGFSTFIKLFSAGAFITQ